MLRSLLFLLFALPCLAQLPSDYFVIHVVDAQTGRGIPMVELKTTSEVTYITDSNGIVAFYEPGLMRQEVYFHVFSHGYEIPEDMFHYRGKALLTMPGARGTIRMKRKNIAERLYRVTGEGIYRDSLLAGQPVPIEAPALQGKVMGQDTVMTAPYRGKLFWIFGDTNKPSHPLGNFGSSGAVSAWNDDPERGINLNYYVDASGFSKKMAPMEGGMIWLFALLNLPDEQGRERLIAQFNKMKSLDNRLDSGLVVFNDQTEIFEKLVSWGGAERKLEPSGRPFVVEINGQKFVYFVWPGPKPVVRVKFDWKSIQDLKQYEGLVCPQQGQCEWRAGTEPSTPPPLLDIETGKPQNLRMLSVNWNEYRKRWIGILEQMPGEVWFAEADTPAGPWLYSRRIINHQNYNFYWAGHLPWFDRQGGKRIFIMGTYTNSFTNNPFKTPRYNYNQIMYGLSLDDPRLALPAPVYRLKDGSLAMRDEVERRKAWDEIAEIPFYRLPSGSAKSGKTWSNSSKTLPLDRAARANVTQ